MNNRKNQNSVLVLVTLGVYLGLVLAGAPPQILAQAAMTKEFSVKDEIEKHDGLDENPNRDSAADGFDSYLSLTEEFVKTLRELRSSLSEGEDFREVEYSRTSWLTCGVRGGITAVPPGKAAGVEGRVWSSVYQFTDHIADGIGVADCIPTTFKNKPARLTNTHIRIALGSYGLVVELNVRKSSWGEAHRLLEDLQQSQREYNSSEASQTRVQLLRHSNFRSQTNEDNVLVYTALPRGALDSLLAKDAK